jgi:5-methyltetrahydrofolate--homocysteine methyltransferase
METKITRGSREVIIGHGRPTVLIGERINPAGKKKLGESLKAGSMDIVRQEAINQKEAGADIIDVNVGMFGVDEVTLLPLAVRTVMEAVDLPICIDSANPVALEAALKVYDGKALVNSVSGEEKSLTKVLPLIKQHNAAVIGLVQDDEGIPKNAARRVVVAASIVSRAEAAGIMRENIIIDVLAFAVGAEPASVLDVMEAIRRITAELGVNTTMGASNISFGLPDREIIGDAFNALVIGAGATALIVDVAKAKPGILAADLLLKLDAHGRRYIQAFRQRQQKN